MATFWCHRAGKLLTWRNSSASPTDQPCNTSLTATARYDHIDLDTSDETRYTVGLNLRPIEETVIRLDYEVYDRDDDSNGIIFSVASYF